MTVRWSSTVLPFKEIHGESRACCKWQHIRALHVVQCVFTIILVVLCVPVSNVVTNGVNIWPKLIMQVLLLKHLLNRMLDSKQSALY